MTAQEDERPTARWTWQHNVPAALVDDAAMMGALTEQALTEARRQRLEPVGDPDVDVQELSAVGVAMMATVDTEQGSPWYGLPAEVIEEEVAAREAAARNLRTVRVSFDVAAVAEERELRQLPGWAADEVLRQGLETDAMRVANAGRLPRCGSPANRHDFTPLVGGLMRDGRVPSGVCGKCGRDVPVAELLANAQAEARGERWWENDA